MVRTVISLDEDDKRWLDQMASAEGVSMTEVVRRAIRRYRADINRPSFDQLIDAAEGTWTRGDGLKWQQRLREEWDERPA